MNGRGRLLVNMAIEKDKENMSLNVPSQDEALQPVISLSIEENLEISTDQSNQETHIASVNIQIPSPSTPKVQLVEKKQTDYYISPIRSDQSDFDDSDADPNFVFSVEKTKPSKVVLFSSSSSSTSGSSSSSSSESSISNAGADNENVALDAYRLNTEGDAAYSDSQHPTTSTINDQETITEQKKGKKKSKKTVDVENKSCKNTTKFWQSL